MKPRKSAQLVCGLAFTLLSPLCLADVVYDAGPGPVGSDLAALPTWTITGSGDFTGNIGGIDDGGTPAYQLIDDNLPAAGNGPNASYSYLADFGLTNTQADLWTARVNMRTLAGDGGVNGVFQVFDSDGVGRWLTFIYEDTAGNLVMDTLASIINLGANDDAYHDYELRGNGDGSANFYFNGVDQGIVPFRATDSPGALGVRMDVGSGSTGATGGWHINQVEFVGTPGVPRPVLVIDRDTGNITLNNNTMDHVDNLVGYTILSSAGSLDQSGWDQQASGSQLANDNDQWIVLTQPDVSTDLAEAVIQTAGDGDGGRLTALSGAWNFGNVWRKTPFEDIALELLIDDGSEAGLLLTSAAGDIDVEYTGADVLFGDLAGTTVNDAPDGDVNLIDWLKFRAGVGTDISSLNLAEAYITGDLNGDLRVNHFDFNAFVAAYDSQNGTGAFAAAVSSVPEPATAALFVAAMLTLIGWRIHRQSKPRWVFSMNCNQTGQCAVMGVALSAIVCWSAAPAYAVSDFVLGGYDADADNPTSASEIQSPEEQGWIEWAAGIQGQDPNVAVQEGVIGNDNTNAWLNDDVGNTNPGYFRDIDPSVQQAMYDFGWKYEFVMTMTAGGHFTAYQVGGDNPWGLPANSRVGFAPSTNGDTITFAPVNSGGTNAIVTPSGTVGDFYRVVVAGDSRSTGGSVEVFDFSDGTQVGGAELYTSWAATTVSNSINRLGIQSGSSPNAGRTAQIHSMNFFVPAPDTLTLQVNTTNGNVKLINTSSNTVNFNGYFIESEGGQLNDGGWTSLDSINLDDPTPGNANNGDGWEEFDSAGPDFLGEGFLIGVSSLAPGGMLSLGNAYNPNVAGIGVDGDLSFTLTDELGRSVLSSLFSTIDYVTSAAVAGDYNGNGVVDAGDYTLWRDNLGAADESGINNNGDGGGVTGSDYTFWRDRFGNTSGSGSLSTAAVPEPSTAALVLLAMAGGWGLASRRKARSYAGLLTVAFTWIVAWAVAGSPALAAVHSERLYTLGDEMDEGANAGDTVGMATGGVSYDSAGTIGAGDLQDLNVINGPTYVDVSNRPGAASGDLGAAFNGSSDALSTGISMNAPAQMWDNGTFFPGPPTGVIFPHNYEGLFSHGIQLWAKPDQTALGTATQTLVRDTAEHGIGITATGNWDLLFDKLRADTGVSVASTLDENGWAHVMQIAGFSDRFNASTASGGALLVNGVAVVARSTPYDPATTELVLGADPAAGGTFVNFYDGTLDDVEVFLWGDNSNQLGQDGAVGGSNTGTAAANGLNADGQNWGTLDLGTDNEWIARELASMNVTDRGDVDLSGGAANGADVTEFLMHWRKQFLVSAIQVGDWNSRQEGDLNYDGIVNLRDAMILHNSLEAAGLGGLDFSLLGSGTNVPEPATCVLAALGLMALGGYCRRRA